mmetsp:Transcript_13072/g.30161  ORF Transcript_13072/g.30161 Transcript_13072/m.30161 type:complete len:202 (+) Transcript_13072:153-758(+)
MQSSSSSESVYSSYQLISSYWSSSTTSYWSSSITSSITSSTTSSFSTYSISYSSTSSSASGDKPLQLLSFLLPVVWCADGLLSVATGCFDEDPLPVAIVLCTLSAFSLYVVGDVGAVGDVLSFSVSSIGRRRTRNLDFGFVGSSFSDDDDADDDGTFLRRDDDRSFLIVMGIFVMIDSRTSGRNSYDLASSEKVFLLWTTR